MQEHAKKHLDKNVEFKYKIRDRMLLQLLLHLDTNKFFFLLFYIIII